MTQKSEETPVQIGWYGNMIKPNSSIHLKDITDLNLPAENDLRIGLSEIVSTHIPKEFFIVLRINELYDVAPCVCCRIDQRRLVGIFRTWEEAETYTLSQLGKHVQFMKGAAKVFAKIGDHEQFTPEQIAWKCGNFHDREHYVVSPCAIQELLAFFGLGVLGASL